MNNKKGQSLIDLVFAIGILILTLTGVIILVINTAKLKTVNLERNKAVQFSQKFFDQQIVDIRTNPNGFWGQDFEAEIEEETVESLINGKYKITYEDCDPEKCKVILTITWGENKELKTERLFVKNGI